MPFSIPFRRPFHAAGKEVRVRSGLLLRLRACDGRVGIGEAAPHPLAAPAVVREAFAALASLLPEWTSGRRVVEAKFSPVPSSANMREKFRVSFTLEGARRGEQHEVISSPSLPPVARAAVDMACHDLAARALGVRVAELLGSVRREAVPINAVVDDPDPRQAAATARRFAEQGFRCIKIKIEPRDMDTEEQRLALIRDAVGEAVSLRVDANAAWTVGEAIAAIPRLAVCGLEYVEQPVAEIAGLAAVRRAVGVPIAADESVTGVEAVGTIAAAGAADVIVVKPSLLGLTAAAAVVSAAQANNLAAVITSVLETSVGLAAALHLAATLPEPSRPCGLATVPLLAGDLVSEPLVPHGGCLRLPTGPGLGVRLDEVACQRWLECGGTSTPDRP